MEQWNLVEVFIARCSKCGENCEYPGGEEDCFYYKGGKGLAIANAKSAGWKFKDGETLCKHCSKREK